MGDGPAGVVEALKRCTAQVARQPEQSNSAPLQSTGTAAHSTLKPGRSKHTFAPLHTTGVAAYSSLKMGRSEHTHAPLQLTVELTRGAVPM